MADIRFERATRIYPGSDIAAVDALDLDPGAREKITRTNAERLLGMKLS